MAWAERGVGRREDAAVDEGGGGRPQVLLEREREERGILFDASARLDGLRRLG